MRQLSTLLTIGALAAAMAFGQAPAQRPGAALRQAMQARLQGNMKGQIQGRMLRALNLTDAQKEQAKAIRQATREQAKPLADQLKTQRQALQAAVQAGDTTKIQQVALEVGNLQGHVLAVRAAGQAKFLAILTPEQKAKMADFRAKVKEVTGRKG